MKGRKKPRWSQECEPKVLRAFRSFLQRRSRHSDSIGPDAAGPEVSPKTEARLLFRAGFLLHPAAIRADGPEWCRLRSRWRRLRLADLALWLHPETEVAVEWNGKDFTVMVGEAWFAHPPYDRDPCAVLSLKSGTALETALADLSGRFAVIARRGSETAVFNDAFGSRTVCYRAVAPYAVASHSEILALAFCGDADPEVARFLTSRFWKKMPVLLFPGDVTAFGDVFLLAPNNAFFLEAGRTRRYWPRRGPAAVGYEDFATACDLYFEGMARALSARPVWLSITGGFDSRLLLAALDRFGVAFQTVTWTKLNFQPWEEEPVAEISRRLGRPHFVVDGRNDRPSDIAVIGARNGGRRVSRPHSSVSGMGRLLAGDSRSVFVRGVGGEAIRGFFQSKPSRLAALSVDEMVRAYAIRVPADDHDARDFVRSAFEAYWRRGNFADPGAAAIDPNDLFYWEHRLGTWAAESLNTMDPACRNLLGYNSRRLAETAYGLPSDQRLGGNLFTRLIARYRPDLADIPMQ